MRKTLYLSGLLSALLLSGGVDAAGLGRLIVNSSLGQPLRAEIELLAVSKEELGSIGATLASREVFRQARIERTEAVNALRFSIDQRPNGKPVLRITSTAPIQDPFLDVLIELSWGSGRLLREYTILLDPPADARPTPAAPQPAAVTPPMVRGAAPPPVSSVPEATPEMLRQRPLPTDIPPPPPKAAVPYGPVRSGETLRGIATKTLPDGITLEQMMVGIYHRNRDAFLNNNMSFLKKGATLTLPGHDDAMRVDPGRALREVRMHAADWHAYRRQLAAAAGAGPDEATPESQAAAGRVVPKVEDKAAPPPAAGKDVLKLSRGEPSGAGKADARNLEKIQALEEELAAKGRALQEAQDRVTKLEQTVHDMQRLLEMKTQEAARTPAPPVAPAAEEPVAVPTPPPAPTPAPQEKAVPPAMPAPIPVSTETSWLSTFVGNPLYIGGIVAAVLLSSLLWLMVVGSRRRKGLNSFEDSIMTGGEFKKDAAVFNTGTGVAAGTATEGSMLLTDFSRLGLGAIDTHEVDPIAEAEVYMAYGRDAQAEEILREALSKDPGRHELTIKLLEIYSSRKDPVSFETLASELYASLGGQPTEVWQKAADMGRTLDPDNPLYRIAPIVAAAPVKAASEKVPAEKAQEEEQEFTGTFEDVAWIHAVSGSGEQVGADKAEETAESLSGLEAGDHLIDFDTYAVEKDQASIESVETDMQQPAEVEDLLDLPEEQEASEPFDVDLPEEAAPLEEIAPAEEAAIEEIPVPQVEELEEAAAPTELAVAEEEAFSPEDLDVLLEGGDEAEPAPIDLPEKEEGVSVEEAYRSLVAEPDEAIPTEQMPAIEPGIPEPEAEDEAEAQAGMHDLDFSDIDLDLAEAPPEPSAFEVSEPPIEEVVAQPVDTPKSVIDPEIWEETNTKLDLARAYLDMGDKEGAREILQEVLTDGDAQQQESARKLLHEAD